MGKYLEIESSELASQVEPLKGCTVSVQEYSEHVVHSVNSEGERHGPYVQLKNGARVEEGNYTDGGTTGHWVLYWNGSRREGIFLPGRKKEGEWLTYDNSGEVVESSHYIDGFESGKYTIWENGAKIEEGLQKRTTDEYDSWRNAKHGPVTRWYPDGQIRVRGTYIDEPKYYQHHFTGEVRIGLWEKWWPNGNKKSEGWFSGKDQPENKNKTHKRWYESGGLESVNVYKDAGGEHISHEHRYPSGALDSTMVYSYDNTATRKRWYENGKLKSESHWRDHLSERSGIWTRFYEDGTQEMETVYGASALGYPGIQLTTYHTNGQIESKGQMHDYALGSRIGPWVSYWENGELKEEGHYDWMKGSDGKSRSHRHGTFHFYNEDGSPDHISEYKIDKEIGRYETKTVEQIVLVPF